jgi:2-dehydro-3-deoxyphosphogluconate aldolase/(4S)-4-hydroxy-2-oxoglutarate aldolase
VRSNRAVAIAPVAEALVAGGVTAIEITLTTPNAIEAISEAGREVGQRALVGAGSVVNRTACDLALAAGAAFIVSPICRPELVAITHAAGRPVMLGAYTPPRRNAHEAGADFVKIFPPMDWDRLI